MNMQSPLKNSDTEYAFELSDEVFEKIQSAEVLHVLIPEDNVRDLEYVDISGKIYRRIKRIIDILIALCALIVLSVPMAIISLAVYIDDPGDVIFMQYRVGLHGKRFKLYKFRTMKMQTPKYLATAQLDDPDRYITRLGNFLRKLSLDEIPQFVNVLKGDMSLVGPRPLISDEYEMHIMRARFGVYNLRPGITGLAQVNGRDLIEPEEKIRWDVRYLKEFGLKTDLKILLTTIPYVLKKKGINEGGLKDR